MKKVLILVAVFLICISTIVVAKRLPTIATNQRTEFKTMLKNYFHPVLHGYGIGFTSDTYITAKWHIVNVKILARNRIREIISGTNTSEWSQVRDEIQNALQNEGTEIKKGRIRIGNTTYLLTNIQVSDETASADIREMPDYEDCKQQNISAEECETNAEKVGDMSLTKKTKAFEEIQGDPRVWAGTLNFKEVEYTFVTFAYPRW
jgi:hypothetical protein